MEPLIAFYHHQAPDHRGRWLQEIWQATPLWLEQTHDYIQWLFPLPEPSPVNPRAPLLTVEARILFANDPVLQQELRRSLQLMLKFLGLEPHEGEISLRLGLTPEKLPWLSHSNHNQLRISRMIRCLVACGLVSEGLQLQHQVLLLGQHRVNPDTLEYWRHAHEQLPPLPVTTPASPPAPSPFPRRHL